jgi:hypothetical protein
MLESIFIKYQIRIFLKKCAETAAIFASSFHIQLDGSVQSV